MIKHFTSLILGCFFSAAIFGQTFSGTLTVTNWRPGSGRGTSQTGVSAARGPAISSMNVRWSFTPKGELLTETFNTQWYLGTTYFYNGTEVALNQLEGAESKLSIVSATLDADVYAGGIKISRILVDLGVTPPHGGTWGPAVVREIPWEQLFSKAEIGPDSAKVLYAKRIELKNASLRVVTFGGLDQTDAQVAEIMKQEQHRQLVAQGDQAMAANDFLRASSLYEQALGLYNVPAVQEKLAQARYSHHMQQGDMAMNQRNFPLAMQQFQLAAGINATPLAQERMVQARFSIPMTQGELALANRDFPAAIAFFEEASRIAPRPEALERLGVARYQLFMSRGDALAREGRFGDAIGEYEQAGRLFPAETAPKEAIARAQTAISQNNAFNELLPALTRQYQEAVTDLEGKQTAARAQAIDAMLESNEACHLENLAFFSCELDYSRKKLASVREEAEFKAYGTPRKTPVPETSPCRNPACQVSMPPAMTKPYTSAQYLEVARRKYAAFQRTRDEAFRNRSKELTDLSLQQNNRNAPALAFSALFAGDPMQKMALIRQAEQIEPRNAEVAQSKAAIMPDFLQALRGCITQGNSGCISSAQQSGLITPDLILDGYPLTAFAVIQNQPEIMNQLLGNRPPKEELQRLLFLAAEKNAAAPIGPLISRGVSATSLNAARETPLMVATRTLSRDAVETLMRVPGVAAGAGPALLLAVESGDMPLVKGFLDQQTDINVRNANGEGIVSVAIDHRDVPMVDFLLGYRQDLDQVDNLQRTPLAHAAAVRSTEMIALLCAREVDVVKALTLLQRQSESETLYLAEAIFAASYATRHTQHMEQAQRFHPALALQRTASGKTWFTEALNNNRPEVCELLLASTFDVNQPLDGEYPLISACDKRMQSVVLALLTRKGANPNVLSRTGENALHVAVKGGFMEGVSLLLANGAQINMTDAQGNSPLCLALDKNQFDVVNVLLNARADITLATRNGQQPIHLAVIKRQQAIVDRLLGMGADVNAPGADRMTPLHYAAQTGDAALCTLLVSKGGSKTAVDGFKRTPAKVASQNKFKAVAKQLKP